MDDNAFFLPAARPYGMARLLEQGNVRVPVLPDDSESVGAIIHRYLEIVLDFAKSMTFGTIQVLVAVLNRTRVR